MPALPHLRAVIFDLGGVVLGSPLHAIAAYERERGIPPNFINRVVAQNAPNGAWSRLERGEATMAEFAERFGAECQEAGHRVDVRQLFAAMAAESQPRAAMLGAIQRIRSAGLKAAALTNNWASEDANDGTRGLAPHFDVFVESVVEGLRKPDPRIYELVCERLSVQPREAAFLDDIGANLKPARAMGMTTIRVVEPRSALGELADVLGLDLGQASEI